MAVYTMARFEVRPEAREQAERAMHDFASFVRAELAGSTWTTYRDPDAPHRFVSFIRSDNDSAHDRYETAAGTTAFVAALQPIVVGPIEVSRCELVTSSDLAPLARDRGGRTPSGTRSPRASSRRGR